MDNIGALQDIIRDLQRIKREERLSDLDDNILFDGAVRVYNSLLINQQQLTRKARQTTLQTVSASPMTDKQRRLLETLRYQGNMDITKAEAAKLIQNYVARRQSRSGVAASA